MLLHLNKSRKTHIMCQKHTFSMHQDTITLRQQCWTAWGSWIAVVLCLLHACTSRDGLHAEKAGRGRKQIDNHGQEPSLISDGGQADVHSRWLVNPAKMLGGRGEKLIEEPGHGTLPLSYVFFCDVVKKRHQCKIPFMHTVWALASN